MTLRIAGGLIVLVLLGQGCPSRIPEAPTPAKAVPAQEPPDGADQKPVKSTYEIYSSEKFAAARAANRPVILYYWAVWCPICKIEEPRLRRLIEQSPLGIKGFRVDYDNDLDVVRQYNIFIQHTAIYLNADGEEVARTIGTQTDEQIRTNIKKISK